jgi:hypothetical protein
MIMKKHDSMIDACIGKLMDGLSWAWPKSSRPAGEWLYINKIFVFGGGANDLLSFRFSE